MIKRPQNTDTDDDVLEMQKEFLSEKTKNKSFQPAAQAVRVTTGKKQSLFAQIRSQNVNKEKNLKSKQSSAILGDIVEKKFIRGTDPPPSGERNVLKDSTRDCTGFPKVERIDSRGKHFSGKSLFAMSLEKRRKEEPIASTSFSLPDKLESSFGDSSFVVSDEPTAQSVHNENVKLLGQMSKEEIFAERERLLESLDPNLVEFLKKKRQTTNSATQPASFESIMEENPSVSDETETKPMAVDDGKTYSMDPLPAVEILNTKDAEKWVHFNVIENEKLEWMKDVPVQARNLKPGESFEARFDWKGVLLPYNDTNTGKDERELYLHGEEPHRPGYTLQELFRLARSNVMQQRISAFGSIAGILNIYNQGFYDSVLEIPITKIFFLLRFGFDENAPAILEIVSKGLAALFYNDTDETLLDLTYETPDGFLQPILEVEDFSSTVNKSSGLENDMSKLNLSNATLPPYTATLDETEEQTRTSMTDLQLAETDLVDCLLRTNIVQRISYILGTVRPQNSTVYSCLKILIRIARTNKDACFQILANTGLIESIFEYFLPRIEQTDVTSETEIYFYPQYFALKLLRIMAAQHLSICLKFASMNIVDKIKNYLFSRKDIRSNLIKVQIESFRLLRTLLLMTRDNSLFRELLPALRYLLEWHYQNVEFKTGGSFLIRQHSSALNAIICLGTKAESKSVIGDLFAMCCSKWCHEATKHEIREFSQSVLLASCLNGVCYLISVNDKIFKEFTEEYLPKFLASKNFENFISGLSQSSILLKDYGDRKCIHPPLPNIGSVLTDNEGSPHLILAQSYPVYLLQSIFKLMERLLEIEEIATFTKYIQVLPLKHLTKFLTKISSKANKTLAMNFFAKNEVKLTFKMVCFQGLQTLLTKERILQATCNLLSCMTVEHIHEIETLLETIIFTKESLNYDQKYLSRWKLIYMEKFVYPHSIFVPASDLSLSMPCSRVPILPKDWPYTLIKELLDKYLKQLSTLNDQKKSDFSEKDTIVTTLSFTELLESNGLEVVSPTEKLLYLMIAFLGPESEFLQPEVNTLLKSHITRFYERVKDLRFQFDGTFEGKSKFENLYILFLEQFQASSYGDEMFSSLVLIPLAQKYDCKWRKMVWSEHASVLRFLNCREDQLLGCIDDYFEPIEDDISLIKCYSRALSTNLLRPNTISHRIATHHVKNFTGKPSGGET